MAIDGFLIVASLAVVRNALLGERTLYQWMLVGVFTSISVVFNVIHAPDNALAQVIGAIPPLALVLAFEMAMAQLKSQIERGAVVRRLAELTQEAERLARLIDTNQSRLDALKAAVKDTRKENRANMVKVDILDQANVTRKEQARAKADALLAFYADNPDATQVEAGAFVDRSRQWVSATLSDLEDSGVIQRNGSGVEVVQHQRQEAEEAAE